MKQENHNLSVKRRIYSFPQEGESRAEAICRSFKLYTLVEWAAYTKVDIRIETSKNCPLLIGELSQLMFLLPFFSDAAKVSFSQAFNEANEEKTSIILMKEIAFDSLLLIAADDVSQQAINQLRSEGIYSIENRSCTLINMVVVSTAEGAEYVHQVLENYERARKNVVVKMTPELCIKDESDIDSILSFLQNPGCNPYMELKHFLQVYHENVEIHGMVGFDFRSFSDIIRGKNVVSVYSYEYQDDIAEAICHLKSVNLKDNGKYLLSFTVGKYDEKTLSKHLASLNENMDAFHEESSLYWTYREATPQKVTLFASISSEQ